MSADYGPSGAALGFPYTPPQGGGGGFANPMTTPGDIIVGGALGAPTRLGVGAEGTVPTVVGGVPAWAAPTQRIPLLAGVVTTAIGADTVAGYARVDPTGLTTLTLEAIGLVVSGVTGTLDLYDLTDAAVAATLSWTEVVATRKTVSVSLPPTPRIYELRVRKSGGAVADYALFSAVNLIGS
jgi:hypothetical protein